MNFAEALAQTAPKKGPSCSVGKHLASLDTKKRAEIEAALADPDVQSSHLARALELMANQRFQPTSVSRHRKASCNCFSGS